MPRQDGKNQASRSAWRRASHTNWDAAPSREHPIEDLPSSSNLLSAIVEMVVVDDSSQPLLFVTAADRRLHIVDVPTCSLRTSITGLQDSPILCCAVFREQVLLTPSMSGQLLASDLKGNIIDKRRDHSKYVVKVTIFQRQGQDLIATAGWDSKVIIYKPSTSISFRFGEPIATITLPTKPEALLFLQHPDNGEPILLISRTDSNFILYYTTESEPRLLGKQNLAPHSNAWVAFTSSAMALCPTDPTLLAVGTSTVPHMKLLIVRLLVPPYSASSTTILPSGPLRTSLLDDGPATETQASQARAALAIADREAAAIQIHCTTMAPQTAYSTPAVAWRPDGSGVWVNGDDGAIRGIEASTGKVTSTLNGHEEGTKVRCLWAGMIDTEESLVSGGFDQKLIVWKTG